ncbi:MAG: alpha-1,2-fucosyltransferase [Bacteroidota bacterium]
MIIVRLQGGMGNQMFQYAAGRALSIRTNTKLKIDLSYLKDGKLGENVDYRKYGLGNFCIEEKFIDKKDLDQFVRKSLLFKKLKISWLNRQLSYRLPISKIYSQKGHGYNPDFLKLSPNTYLVGYWQNPEFFAGVEDKVKQDFVFKKLPVQSNTEMLDKITGCNSVSVHVRRGDFKNLPVLGTIGPEFYLKAISYILEQISNPVLYFFSDDMNWVRVNFNEYSKKCRINYVDLNNSPGSEIEDLRLMSNCKHNILGNSTFGWWGAWLNGNPEKKVVAPERLFADPSINRQLQGMIPDNWIRL